MIPRPLQPSSSRVSHFFSSKDEIQHSPNCVQNTDEMPAMAVHWHPEALQASSRKSNAIHLKSVALAAKESRENPSAIVQALITFSSSECKQHVLQKLFSFESVRGAEGAAAPLTSSNVLWETQDASAVSAVIVNLSKRQFDKAIGVSALENHCVKSISTEACYLASQAEMIKNSETNNAPTEKFTHWSLDQMRLTDKMRVLSLTQAPSCLPSKLALIADGVSTDSSKVLKALKFGSTKQTQLTLEPYVGNNADSACSKIAQQLQDYDVELIAINAAEINKSDPQGALGEEGIGRQAKSYIPSHKLFVSLEHILNLPESEMPKAIMVFESNNISEYNPDIVVIESLIQLLKAKNIPVFIHPSTPKGSWLNRIMYTERLQSLAKRRERLPVFEQRLLRNLRSSFVQGTS